MYQVFHLSAARDAVINIITKTTLLCVISSMTLLLFLIPFFLNGIVVNSHHVLFVANFMIVVDLFTNFLSVWLSYRCFDSYYFKICGFCDASLRKYIGGETIAKDVTMLQIAL